MKFEEECFFHFFDENVGELNVTPLIFDMRSGPIPHKVENAVQKDNNLKNLTQLRIIIKS